MTLSSGGKRCSAVMSDTYKIKKQVVILIPSEDYFKKLIAQENTKDEIAVSRPARKMR